LLCCDIRIATEHAVFAVPAARIGLAYRYPGIAQFIAAVGPAYTSEIFMTARRYDALEALQMRLVSRLVPAHDLDGTVADYSRGSQRTLP
jgi:enoyl-CoA hydratase